MFESLESGAGLDIVVWLQQHGNIVFDMLAIALHGLGSTFAYILLLPVFYWSWNKDLGRRLLFALLFSGMAIIIVKNLVDAPRPHLAYPDRVEGLVTQDGFGFPSGHTTNALVLGGVLASWLHRRSAWIIVALYTILMGWSRMYAGVHYPEDVVGGIIGGGLLLVPLTRYYATLTAIWDRLLPWTKLLLIVVIATGFAIIFRDDPYAMVISGAFLGAGVATLWEEKVIRFTVAGLVRQRVLRYVIGIVFVLAIYFITRLLFPITDPIRLFRYFLVAFSAVGLYPWLFSRHERNQRIRNV